jgi:uncharacterized phage-associated protein
VIQLIKLVYIAHGWNLALKGEPLVSDDIEAWKYGPVMPNLFRLLNEQIRKRGFSMGDALNDAPVYVSDMPIAIADCNISPSIQILLNKVYVRFKDLTGQELSALTHETDTPWYRVWDNGEGRDRKIEDVDTKAYYEKKINRETFDSYSQFASISSKEEARELLTAAGILGGDGQLSPLYKQ